MLKFVFVLWLCVWWLGQSSCHKLRPRLSPSTTSHSTWMPTTQFWSPLRRPRIAHIPSVRSGRTPALVPQPVPGITEANVFKLGNTTHIVPSTNTDIVSPSTSTQNSNEYSIYLATASPKTSSVRETEDRVSGQTRIRKDSSTDHNSSTMDGGGNETPKMSAKDNKKDPHPLHASDGHTLISDVTNHSHSQNKPLDNFTSPKTFTAADNYEGDRREGLGRVTTGPKDLCSFCLCDSIKENVFCKHEHINHRSMHHLNLTQRLIPSTAKSLHITGFEKLTIASNTFSSSGLKLRNIHFENIEKVELYTLSLHFSAKAEVNMEVPVIFTRCNIPKIPQQTLTQQTRSDDPSRDIKLEQTRFLTLKFDECNITTMRSYAFFNARILYFDMSKSKIDTMEENSIHLDTFAQWTIENSNLPQLIQKSICLRAHNVVVFSRNNMRGLENRSLDITSFNQVLFEYNFVSHLGSEALLGIRPHSTARGANIVFLNNTILKADKRSLITNKTYPMHELKIIDNRFNILCNCDVKATFGDLLGITSTSDYYDQEKFKAIIKKSRCQVYANVPSYINMEEHMTQECTLPVATIVAAATVSVVIVVTIVVCVVCTRRAQKAKEEANYLGECCYSQSFSTLHSNPQLQLYPFNAQANQSWDSNNPLQPWVVAVPEVKTYQENELDVAYEHTEPMNVSLRGSFPPEPGPLIDFKHKTQMRSSCPFN